VAYTVPVITPSGVTFSQLNSLGPTGLLDSLADGNAATATERRLAHRLLAQLSEARAVADSFLSGAPVNRADVVGRLATAARSAHLVATAADELAALIDGAP
jgi:hypothetical protein